MNERMARAEIRRYLDLAAEDLSAARDNLRLGYLRAAVSRAYYLGEFLMSEPEDGVQ